METEIDEPSSLCRFVAGHCGGPLLLAWVATLATLLIAYGKGGSFDRELAIQTGSLLALIWYVYFTFRMARPEAWVALRINPDLKIDPLRNLPTLHPEVENKTNRQLQGRMTVRLWVDKEPVDLDSFYRGEDFFPIHAGLRPSGVIPLKDHLEWSADGFEDEEILVAFKAEWIDVSLCEEGGTTKYWRINLQTGQTAAFIARERIEENFEPLPDPYEDGH